MAYRAGSLPNRFPIGTKFVIEGQPRGEGEVQVFKRYLEFPDGTFVRLPAHPAAAARKAKPALRGARAARRR